MVYTHEFDDELCKLRVNAAKNSVFLTEITYLKLINYVQKAKMTTKKETRDYWLLNRYDVMIVESKSKLIYPVKEGANTIKYYVTDNELFHVLHEAHLSIGHGGRDRIMKELSTKYNNITRHDIELYIHLCEPSQKKQKGIKKGIVVKPMVFSDFNSHCQVDLIDFLSQPDKEYKFIMVYQDHLTKFVILRTLTSKRAEEAANNLVDIFTLLGAPSILQSDNGREFVNNVVTSLKEFWPALKPRHSQSQGSVERANQDIENILCAWMQDNKSDRWSEGLRFVQFTKNRAYHSGIKRTPYEALSGCKPKLGLTTFSLPEDVLKDVNTEEQLGKVIESVQIMDKDETNQIMQEKKPVSKNTHKIIGDNELNQHDEGMLTEETFISDTCCVCLRETGDALACKMCLQKIHTFCGHTTKGFQVSSSGKVIS
nr:KRAB-A domain-containing protein 2-like [Parasteatoda tepidariorum]